MFRIEYRLNSDSFPKENTINETEFHYYYYVGNLSFVFSEGKIQMEDITLGNVCVQLRSICNILNRKDGVKQDLEFTEGEGIITIEKRAENVFIHPDFIHSEKDNEYLIEAPEEYGFVVPIVIFTNEAKNFYRRVTEEILSVDDVAKRYIPEW